VFGEFDGVLVDGDRCVQEIGAVGDVLVDDNFLNRADFLDHYFGESFGLTGCRKLVLAFALLLLSQLLAGTEAGVVILATLSRTVSKRRFRVVVA